jgi:hypothetical protein
MSEPDETGPGKLDETGRDTTAQWVPIGTRGHWPTPGPVEDYEALGSTFLGGHGNSTILGQVVEEEEIEYEPPVEWHKLFLAVFFLAALVSCALVGWWLSHLAAGLHLPSFHAGSSGGHWSPQTGSTFAYLFLPAGVILFLYWLIKGR